MRQLNELFHQLKSDEEGDLSSFIPELIDILCPEPSSKPPPPAPKSTQRNSSLSCIQYKNERYDLS